MRCGWHAKLAFDLARGEVRRHDDGVRAVRMLADESRIVAADLRACPLRVRQKVQIVDRNHAARRLARAAAAGCSECVDVESASAISVSAGGQPRRCHAKFRTRHRYSTIDRVHAVELRRHPEAILP